MAKVTRQTAFSIDSKSLDALRKTFTRLSKSFGPAVMELRPQFGAYMAYSLYQEEGTRLMPARPHIEPSVLENAGAILAAMRDASIEMTDMLWKGKSQSAATAVYKKKWLQVLNGVVRIDAVSSGKAQEVFEFGFHLRSIRGYADSPSPSAILSQQAAAQGKRRGRNKRTRNSNRRSTS